ncbi:MAG: Nif3-like dinuclear metal center hexameric protein [Capnocytophaga sp.]|nr:Nif3-like dinuclear metal center hexameric protein [Capnocytophaga sp.]
MKVQQIIDFLEERFPISYAESFDNVGLIVGNANQEISSVLITLDTLEEVVEEAIALKSNLIVSFHPIIFSGLKSLTGKTYVEKAVIKAIQNNISIYAMHTALDNSFDGVNAKICEILELSNRQILIPQKGTICKLDTYVPSAKADFLREKLFEAGAGNIGNYSDCSFNINGIGSFKGNENSQPTIGEKNKLHFEEETQISVIFSKHLQKKILKHLFENHPYEEVAYQIYSLENKNQHIGMGMIGELSCAMDEKEFLNFVKKKMNTQCIRHSQFLNKKIKKVAVLGGSGAFAIDNAIQAGADAYITSDIKYHEFFKAEQKILLADIGHYESEQFTKNLLLDEFTKKIPNFAFYLSKTNTNPINYL